MVRQIATVSTLVERWRGQLLDLVFPPRCVNCRRVGAGLCPDCLSKVQLVTPPFCSRCSHPLQYADQSCAQCRLHPLHIGQIRAVAYHEGPVREAIHALKYNQRTDLVAPLCDQLESHLGRSPVEFDLITAVPLAPLRLRARGYNQAELLARALAARHSRPYVGGLQRLRETADQIGLGPKARRENVDGAFQAEGVLFRGQRILLIDDVCTTGATLDACAVALTQQGAKAVVGLTVARPR